jgi:hypothetical protein
VLPRHTRTRGVTAVAHDNVHELANQLDIIQEVAAEELEDLRTLVHGIYPRHLHQHGPASALWSLARSSLVTIQVNDEGADACRRQSKQRCTSALVRRFQNTAKPAGPNATAPVTLARQNGAIEFTVNDDGAGTSPDSDLNGFGIPGMRDRSAPGSASALPRDQQVSTRRLVSPFPGDAEPPRKRWGAEHEMGVGDRRGDCSGGGCVSRRLTGTSVTPAMAFALVGVLVGPLGLDEVTAAPTGEGVRTLAEATLAVVLFADASRIKPGVLRRESAVPLRLLGIGLPLTIAMGAVLAAVIFDQLNATEAIVLAILLAPTDAALGEAVVSEPRLPSRIRQGLNVESGLNDGICVPLLLIALAAADVEDNAAASQHAIRIVAEQIGYGVLGGVAAGSAAAAVIAFAYRRDLISSSWLAGHSGRRRRPRLRNRGRTWSSHCSCSAGRRSTAAETLARTKPRTRNSTSTVQELGHSPAIRPRQNPA